MMDLRDCSALVTGGAGGFGGATARRLAQAGARVVVADINDERGQAMAKELGNGSIYVRTDVMDEGSVAEMVAKAAEIGPLRAAVIVHAGPPHPEPVGRVVDRKGNRLSTSHFNHYINIYLNSAYCVTSYAAEAMAKTDPVASDQRGVIINTASIAGFEGQTGQVPYGAAKAGVIGMVLTLARDLAPLGIRAMAIAPGTFLTYAYSGFMSDEEAQAKWGPMVLHPKRMGDPDEYARLAAHIVENDFLNGTTIRLDGGQRFA
jgi:NAD(P)-dependent dehydrogenase (short-subunit alcohol dehydrogenase family)